MQYCAPVLPFSKQIKIFFGYFDPENIFIDSEHIFSWGELTDNSAKKEALLRTIVVGGQHFWLLGLLRAAEPVLYVPYISCIYSMYAYNYIHT